MNGPVYPPDWADPLLTGRNRILSHSPHGAYPDAETARSVERGASPYVRSLAGTWKFRLTSSPLQMPEGFLGSGFDDAAWHDMRVPSNWQLDEAVADEPIYTNISYPFCKTPPELPEVNPTGWYRTAFEIPDSWQGRSVFLVLESCDSACKVWINGVEVGYSEDSKLPHEFDITPLLRAESNTLAVMAPRYCTGFWLEDQDYWHLSGIQRDVLLVCKPTAHIRDWVVRTHLDEAYRNATLEVRAYMNPAPDIADGYHMSMELFDAEGQSVVETAPQPVALQSPMYQNTEQEYTAALFRVPVGNPKLWTAETPHLYTLVISLISPGGTAVDFESCRVGFRQVEIRDRQLLLNGRRLIVRGVNWHVHHPERGRALTSDDLRENIIAMKRLNFNAIRTSHYPQSGAFYELCDELGMYVVDEANLETHGVEAMLSKDPLWMNAYLERAQRLALRDKNHACVVVWSLGNESSCGPHHAAMAAWLRAYDPTRPVQYESGNPGPAITDIMAPMYPGAAWIEKVMLDAAEKRPFIMCEYAYSKGNAGGNLWKYWEMVERYRPFQGGFVWDWADKALVREVNGRREWAYGNEFDGGIGPDGFPYGEKENPQMCLNGIVNPDLRPKPAAWELKKVQAPVGFAADETGLPGGHIRVLNKYLALDLSHLQFEWQLLENGVVVQTNTLEVPPTGPGKETAVTVPFETPASIRGEGEYFLNLTARYRESLPWCESGHEVAWEQWVLPLRATPSVTATASTQVSESPKQLAAGSTLELQHTSQQWVTRGRDFEITFERPRGVLSGYQFHGRQLLTRPLEHCFMRARTDNDYMIGNSGSYYQEWLEAGLDRLRTEVQECSAVQLDAARALVRCRTRHVAEGKAHGFDCESTFLVHGDGRVVLENTVHADRALPVLPRVGMRAELEASLEEVEWYGRGPHENYCDRKHSARIGIYRSTVDEQFFPFVDPCECGGHEDVRRLQLSDGSGVALCITGRPSFHFSALHYTMEDLLQAGHVYELHRTPGVQLHLDGFHMGLGGDTGWTRNVHPEYLLPPTIYRYAFAIQAIGQPTS